MPGVQCYFCAGSKGLRGVACSDLTAIEGILQSPSTLEFPFCSIFI